MRRPVPHRRVALLVETSNSYARGLLTGIGRFVRDNGTWSISLVERGRGEQPLALLKGWKGDGILARIDRPELAKAILAMGVPAVDLCGERLAPTLPWVETDDAAIADLAVSHLCDRGFRHLAFVGGRPYSWAHQRALSVATAAAVRKVPCQHYRLPDARRPLEQWLRALPKPCGIICAYDLIGMQILEVARRIGLPIPDVCAVVGVDDDEVLCSLCSPPLSSVVLDAEGAGRCAARILDRMMNGEAVGTNGRLMPPLRLSERGSTSGMAVADPVVLAALSAMRTHAARGLPISAAVRVAGVSRRTLELRFQSVLGRSPHAQVVRLRLDAIERLLADTERSIADIATQCGFMNPEYLNVFVKRETGWSPGALRRRLRTGSAQV